MVEPGQPGLLQVADTFGDSVLQPDGTLDRRKMRDLVFADTAKRKLLEAILHPLIRTELAGQLTLCDGPYAILSVPLLIEMGLNKRTDRILVIDVKPEVQLHRLLDRDGISESQARAMIAAQLSREERNHAADDIIDNSSSLDHFIDQLQARHRQYLTLAQRINE